MIAAAVTGALVGLLWNAIGDVSGAGVPESSSAQRPVQAPQSMPAATPPTAASASAVEVPSQTAAPTPGQVPTRAASMQVAPGVHVTPIGVSAGQVSMPAGPRDHDSEPEN
jgi:hypothetical protein